MFTAACGADGNESPADPLGTPEGGGVLRLTLSTDPPTLDPFTSSNYAIAWGNLLSALYDPLVWSDLSTGSVHPHLAESLTPDATARVWTLTLRSGVVFSDGEPLDAAAVKSNWDMHADPKSGSAYASGAVGLKLTVADTLHLRIELPVPNANFDRTVANGLNYMVAPKTLGDPVALRTAPIGAGPFVLAAREAGKSLTLRRNPRYWQPGKPYLDGIDVRILAPERTVPAAVADHEADLGEVIDPVQVRDAKKRKLGVLALDLNGGLMVVFNTRRPPFNDPAARQAVVDSLSAAEMNDRFHEGLGTPAKGVFDGTSPLANIQLAPHENDPAQARAAFDRLTAAGSRPLAFSFLTVGAASGTVDGEALYIQQHLQQFPGVKVNVQITDLGRLTPRLLAGDFDMALSALWMTDPEPNLYDFLRPGTPTNVSGYADSAVTDAMSAARRTTDLEARREAYTRVQIQLNQDLPFWVYQEAVNAVVFDPRVTGIQTVGDGVVLFDRIGFRR